MNDQPQPEKVKSCLQASLKKDMKARQILPQCLEFWPTFTCQGTFAPMHEIWKQGYSTTDIISTFAREPQGLPV